jgi:hypothetical protein
MLAPLVANGYWRPLWTSQCFFRTECHAAGRWPLPRAFHAAGRWPHRGASNAAGQMLYPEGATQPGGGGGGTSYRDPAAEQRRQFCCMSFYGGSAFQGTPGLRLTLKILHNLLCQSKGAEWCLCKWDKNKWKICSPQCAILINLSTVCRPVTIPTTKSSTANEAERWMLTEGIDVYWSFPALWDVNSYEHRKREMKIFTYEVYLTSESIKGPKGRDPQAVRDKKRIVEILNFELKYCDRKN